MGGGWKQRTKEEISFLEVLWKERRGRGRGLACAKKRGETALERGERDRRKRKEESVERGRRTGRVLNTASDINLPLTVGH